MTIVEEFKDEQQALQAESNLIKCLKANNHSLLNSKNKGGPLAFKERQGRTLVSRKDVEKM